MILKLWLCTASFLGSVVVVNSDCDARPTGCQRDNNQLANDTAVYPPSSLNCSFAVNLCCYREGCFDDGMGHWNVMNGRASVEQERSLACGANTYSILESRWVTVRMPSCVEFAYCVKLPYQLEVFLAFNNGTLPPLMEDYSSAINNQNHTASFDVDHLTGKIQFRVRGSGGTNVSPPQLHYVRITESRCQTNANSPLQPEVSDPPPCDLVMTTASTTQHTTPSTTTPLISASKDASTSSQPPSAISLAVLVWELTEAREHR
ncbi:uncharacterized protein [Littorina saxatilis]|uniref:uncharacterized protein n=1 Tax=Littorina saxatilis TaxID=31220 RepID=UPI0038B64E98